MSTTANIVPAERIQSRIVVLRGQRVLLDADLAAIYEVPTKRLIEQMKRNADKFPEDFLFQLTRDEWSAVLASRASVVVGEGDTNMWSQNATTSPQRRRLSNLPYAFTEHGALQAANILSSPAAAQMSIAVIRAFVQLRALMVDHKTLRAKLAELDARVGAHDEQLRSALPALRRAPMRSAPPRRSGAARKTCDHLRASRSVAAIVEAIRQLAEPVPTKASSRKIGFHSGNR